MLAEPGAALNIGPRAQHGKRSRSWPYAPNVVEKLFGKSGWIQDRGSESGQMGSKAHRSAASYRQRSPVEGPSAIFQTVSEGGFCEVRVNGVLRSSYTSLLVYFTGAIVRYLLAGWWPAYRLYTRTCTPVPCLLRASAVKSDIFELPPRLVGQ